MLSRLLVPPFERRPEDRLLWLQRPAQPYSDDKPSRRDRTVLATPSSAYDRLCEMDRAGVIHGRNDYFVCAQ